MHQGKHLMYWRNGAVYIVKKCFGLHDTRHFGGGKPTPLLLNEDDGHRTPAPTRHRDMKKQAISLPTQFAFFSAKQSFYLMKVAVRANSATPPAIYHPT
jgi:hypothetical protein